MGEEVEKLKVLDKAREVTSKEAFYEILKTLPEGKYDGADIWISDKGDLTKAKVIKKNIGDPCEIVVEVELKFPPPVMGKVPCEHVKGMVLDSGKPDQTKKNKDDVIQLFAAGRAIKTKGSYSVGDYVVLKSNSNDEMAPPFTIKGVSPDGEYLHIEYSDGSHGYIDPDEISFWDPPPGALLEVKVLVKVKDNFEFQWRCGEAVGKVDHSKNLVKVQYIPGSNPEQGYHRQGDVRSQGTEVDKCRKLADEEKKKKETPRRQRLTEGRRKSKRLNNAN